MPLWTDIVDPATLTGYARASLADYEARRGSLARWLPNRDVADIVVRFVAGATGLINVAKFRAYDAEPEIGTRKNRKRVTLELPAVGQNQPVSEYEQLRGRGTPSDDQVLNLLEDATDAAVRSVADAVERLRGIVLTTGKATITQDNYLSDDDFGRPAGHTVTAPALWSVSGTDAIGQLTDWQDIYRDATGEDPGAILMSTRAFRAMSRLTQFATLLVGGSSRPATASEVRAQVEGAGLPPIELYDRRVSVDGVSTKVVPDDRVMLLPAPVDPNDWQSTDLGATFWGRTLTATEGDWDIPDAEQPGLVVGVWRNDRPPMQAEVISDAIALPVLANADRSFVADVL